MKLKQIFFCGLIMVQPPVVKAMICDESEGLYGEREERPRSRHHTCVHAVCTECGREFIVQLDAGARSDKGDNRQPAGDNDK